VKELADTDCSTHNRIPRRDSARETEGQGEYQRRGNATFTVFKVAANRQVEVLRLEYMLSNDTTVAGEDMARQGSRSRFPSIMICSEKSGTHPDKTANWSDHSGRAMKTMNPSAQGEVLLCFAISINSDAEFRRARMI